MRITLISTSALLSAPPEDIMPIPKVQTNVKRATRKRGKTAILTSTPYKNELEESLSEKTKKVKRNLTQTNKPMKTTSKEKKSKEIKNKVSKEKKNKTNMSDSDPEEEDAECLYCNEFYSKSAEGWVACNLCHLWTHNSCAGIDSDDDETVFACELCQ